jgi:transposase
MAMPTDEQTGALFSYLSPDAMVPKNHPLRAIRPLVKAALARLSSDFARLYASTGRSSIAPEKLLRALLRQAFYSVRSERQLMEQLISNMLFRWFVGLSLDAPVWDVTVFTKNRGRLLEGDIARGFLRAIRIDPAVKQLLSTEHFSGDGTLIEAWASMKSFRPKDGGDEPPGPGRNGEPDFRGKRQSNTTDASTTDPDARLYRKARGRASKLSDMGHLLMENRNGLVVDTETRHATGTAERQAAEAMIGEVAGTGRITLGSDRAFAVAEHVANLREMNVTPHVAQNSTRRSSAIDGRTTRHPGYAVSQRIRKRIEEAFGWVRTTGPNGAGRPAQNPPPRAGAGWVELHLHRAAYNLIRIPKLLAA